jgi:hypothetical protein
LRVLSDYGLIRSPLKTKMWVYMAWIASSLGYAYALSDRTHAAFNHLKVGVNSATSMNVMAYHPLWLAYLSEAHLLAGQTDEAHEHAQRALQLSLKQKEYRPDGCVHTVTTQNGATVLAVVWGRTELRRIPDYSSIGSSRGKARS